MKRGAILEKISVEAFVNTGKGFTKYNGKALFIEKAYPGDIVDVQITRNKKDYLEGFSLSFHQLSEDRTEPFCKHFGTCGGCKLQNISYEKQVAYKHKIVAEAFERIGKLEFKTIDPVITADAIRYFRNKLEFTFSNKGWIEKERLSSGEDITRENALGFHVPGFFDKVIDIEHCYLQRDPSNNIRKAIKDYAEKHNLSFFDLRKQNGFLRNLIIRTTTLGETMVIVAFYEEKKEEIEKLLAYIASEFPETDSLQFVINPKKNDTIHDLGVTCYRGKEYITEQLGGLKFKIGPKSFFQTNTSQALKLYEKAREFADLTGNETVYDLYTGTGTIANYIAGHCKSVIGIEQIPEAIEDAKFNAALNNISNTHFYAGDVKDIIQHELITEHGKPQVIFTNPGRAGMHPKVVQQIADLAPEKLVYISCNPTTQARDIGLLSELYEIKKIQPVDMFPHTVHIENVALLHRRH